MKEDATQGSIDSASSAQDQGSRLAVAEQRRQFDLTRGDLAPWRDTGSAAQRRLSHLLGLNRTAPGGAPPTAGASQFDGIPPTREQFTSAGAEGNVGQIFGGRFAEGTFDEAGYNAAATDYERRKAEFDARAAGTVATEDPNAVPTGPDDFGSLNKKFTLADFWDDPVTKASFQFGLDTGTKALGNMAGAKGNRNSGAQLKALERFATDYTGGQAAGSSTRFYSDQDRTYNRLAGVSGTGQTATTAGAVFGQNTANTVGNIFTAQGNARGAAAIARGNASSGMIGNVGNTVANWFGGMNGGATAGTGYQPDFSAGYY